MGTSRELKNDPTAALVAIDENRIDRNHILLAAVANREPLPRCGWPYATAGRSKSEYG
jgi:hypothetical protein